MRDEILSAREFDAISDGPYAEILRRMMPLVSDRVGIIRQVRLPFVSEDDGRLHVAVADPSATAPVTETVAKNRGISASLDRTKAIAKAIGEAVERYCAAYIDQDQTFVGSAYENCVNRIAVRDFALFSEEQYADPSFPYKPLTDHVNCSWITGRSMISGAIQAVPAAMVYLPYRSPFRDSISTGLACGTDVASASQRALCEVIERDAFMLAWRNRLVLPRLDLDTVTIDPVQELLERFSESGLRCECVLLTLDINIPVILAVLHTEPARPPFISIGLGCGADVEEALIHALEEAGLTYWGLRRALPKVGSNLPDEPMTIEVQALTFAAEPNRAATADFLTSSSVQTDIGAIPACQGGGVNALTQVGLDAIAVDLTTPDVADLGLRVVRVVSPRLQPLDTQHLYQHRGGDRLFRIAQRLGVVDEPRTVADLNLDAHPFP
jgi:ribosomal protein S12 methylthiotransferase accessory factor